MARKTDFLDALLARGIREIKQEIRGMPIENCLNPFALAGGLGLLLGLGWVALFVLSWAWSRTWAWVDDSQPPRGNPLINFVMRRMGWGDGNWLYTYKKGDDESDGEQGFFFPLIALIFGPVIILAAVTVYPLTLSLVSMYLIARLARFARRHKKLFDKHIKDPDAHK